MSAVANTVLRGEAAYLVAAQAELLATAGAFEVYRLKTPELRLGLYDPGVRRLVIVDGAALAALAHAEALDNAHHGHPPAANGEVVSMPALRNAQAYGAGGFVRDPDPYQLGRVIDPPSHL